MWKRTISYQGEEWEITAVQPTPEKNAGEIALIGETQYRFYYQRLDGRDHCTVSVPPDIGRRFGMDDPTRVALGLPRTEPELSEQDLVEILKSKRP